MSVFGKLVLIGVVGGAAGWAGLAAGVKGWTPAMLANVAQTQFTALMGRQAEAMPAATRTLTGPVIYYRHPDGLAEWSATPTETADGKSFLPVLASEDVSFDPEAITPLEAESGERTLLYYRHPMGLPDTSPVPKLDSMRMDYLPVYADEVSDAESVTVSPGKLQRTGVRTSIAVFEPMATAVRAPGIVALDDRRVSVISLRADAFIEEVEDVTTGSIVEAGEPLAMLYSPDIVSAAAQYVSDLRSGEGRVEGSRQRLANLGVPVSVIDKIAADRRTPVQITLMAPRSGVVLERMAVEGMMSEAGETLFRIADTSVVWVMADVPESALAGLSDGNAATITFPGLPGETFSGVIDKIYPEVDMQTRTARVRVDLSNPEGRLLVNMFADVALATGDGAPVVQVPETAVIDTGDRQVVIRDLGEGKFAPQDVVLGRQAAGMVEILEGIVEGDRIVTTSTFLIDAESNLNAALAALTAPEAGE
ncbi:efflux RND transporter periplasmic adaptor subunit [Pseudosulfitobacter sp. DSM 107133]|uniref:efflux RND transporter periplasmic adaptor subunit n=1 Tax=Pseudosulfitobacter sp. DSM 107133 TaxID=2883100 RepID=UPI000DF2345E|nr:efflux RND transporter periplasmic adaptor subunit [Pseudosulfitobacter sp. DSM 107133]UOA30019.1 Cation efflux system protein CusB [Pseudosulfitobacter sp. DSM 107133]